MVHSLRVGQDDRAEHLVLVQDHGPGRERGYHRILVIVLLRGAESEAELHVEQPRFQLLEHRLPNGGSLQAHQRHPIHPVALPLAQAGLLGVHQHANRPEQADRLRAEGRLRG